MARLIDSNRFSCRQQHRQQMTHPKFSTPSSSSSSGSFGNEARSAYLTQSPPITRTSTTSAKTLEAMLAIALCHTVTPVDEGNEDRSEVEEGDDQGETADHVNYVRNDEEARRRRRRKKKGQEEAGSGRSYKASSPDEIALVKFAESVGIILSSRSLKTITLTTPKVDSIPPLSSPIHITPLTFSAHRLQLPRLSLPPLSVSLGLNSPLHLSLFAS